MNTQAMLLAFVEKPLIPMTLRRLAVWALSRSPTNESIEALVCAARDYQVGGSHRRELFAERCLQLVGANPKAFTHLMALLRDQVRSGRRYATPCTIRALLYMPRPFVDAALADAKQQLLRENPRLIDETEDQVLQRSYRIPTGREDELQLINTLLHDLPRRNEVFARESTLMARHWDEDRKQRAEWARLARLRKRAEGNPSVCPNCGAKRTVYDLGLGKKGVKPNCEQCGFSFSGVS